MKIITFLVIVFVSKSSFADSMAREYIDKMYDKYSSIIEYMDNGYSETSITSKNGRLYTIKREFNTFYKKDNTFYFKWVELPNLLRSRPVHYKVWKDNSGIYSKYSTREQKKYENLPAALFSAAGISGGLTGKVPLYLSPKFTCPDLMGAKSADVVKIDDDNIIIKLLFEDGDIGTVYIDKDAYLIQKYEENDHLSDGSLSKKIINYSVIRAK